MWTRSELKFMAKEVLHRTYWMSVVVSLIFLIVGGGGGGGGFSYRPHTYHQNSYGNYHQSGTGNAGGNINVALAEAAKKGTISEEEFKEYINTAPSDIDELPQAVQDELKHISDSGASQRPTIDWDFLLPIIMTVLVIFLVVFTVLMLLAMFVFMPLQIGCYRYFVRARDDEGKVDDVVFAFKDNYKNVVWVMFVRSMKILGWTCLFIIPGIIKSYEYAMIPYLIAENPDMSSEEAFETSRKMMDGNKWAMFVLGLSFIGWVILGVFTCGIGLILYVNPYINLTFAELYHRLKELNGVDPFPAASDTAEAVL